MKRKTFSLIRGLDANGVEFWFTGRAGALFVSQFRSEAFQGFSLEGARAKATALNRMTEVHGLRFVAMVPDTSEDVDFSAYRMGV